MDTYFYSVTLQRGLTSMQSHVYHSFAIPLTLWFM